MPRRPRLTLPNVPLHLIQRGNNRQACFIADEDHRNYLDGLGEYAAKPPTAITPSAAPCSAHRSKPRSSSGHYRARQGVRKRPSNPRAATFYESRRWRDGGLLSYDDRTSRGESAMNASLLNCITIEAGKCGGKPCIRGMRIRVSDILEMLGEGVSMEEILADFPDLEREDILASLQFAARRSDIVRLAA